jgi:hypothetical protein
MAFDQKTRNLLQRTITACRRVFDREFTAQLQELYGIQPDGKLTQCEMLDHLADEELEVARLLRSRLNHLEGGEPSEAFTRTQAKPENVARVIREQAFTVLNRLAALRLCEERGLVLECVRQGVNSEGFQLFMTTAGNALGETHEAYLVYLHCLFDELALDLGVLFDRFSPLALLFPRKDALEAVLRELNGTGKAAENEAISAEQFAEIWKADETIGWIYQYYNDEAERKKMREESSAPRNSRELAVRNQFFTPRYVVEFLTDNTLGRIWHEMRHGQTVLRDRCSFLVRRPTEVFLKVGEAAPESATSNEASREELLRQPVHIPHRGLKDPREIKLLDPACGSMHFGLYAFDLLSVIYGEAWEIAHGPDEGAKSTLTFAPFVSFAANFSDKAAFLLQVPRLIIEHNIHGIDIDPRAAQIAGLSLWLRAQRAWHEAGIKPANRPSITRSNIVCAEPMPGERKLLREFVEEQFDIGERPAFAYLLEKIFDHMALAGEAGSLLRIEERIRYAIDEASVLARSQVVPKQAKLFLGEEKPEPKQLELRGLVAEHFWQGAEQRIYDALEAYAEQAENGSGFQRRLFAEDAAQGFAFIDLCRKRYDVVVMNPPFGEFSKRLKDERRTWYPNTWQDILAAFTERFYGCLTVDGLLGAITSRTGFFLPSLVSWRQEFLVENGNPVLLADLGDQVMDGATVESAAYVIARCPQPNWVPFFRFLGIQDRQRAMSEAILAHNSAHPTSYLFTVWINSFKRLRNSPLAYWVPDTSIKTLEHLPRLVPDIAEARQGLVTGDADRFVRVFWEVPSSAIETSGNVKRQSATWFPYVMRGSSQPWFSPLTIVVNWSNDGAELRNFFNEKGELRSRPRAMDFYFRSGFSWTRRAVRFVPYIIPKGCIPSASRYMAYPPPETALDTLGLAASNSVSAILRFYGEWFCRPNFLVEHLKSLPWISPSEELAKQLRDKSSEEITSRRWAYTSHEPFPEFIAPAAFRQDVDSASLTYVVESLLGSDLENLVAKEYGFRPSEQAVLFRDLREAIAFQNSSTEDEAPDDDDDDDDDLVIVDTVEAQNVAALSYAVGTIFGRWDIRYATGDRPTPVLPDPFSPLPACPPGMLKGDDGLPLSLEAGCRLRVEGLYPLDVAWDGILVDDPDHPLDIERRVRAALTVLWNDRAEALEGEACRLLGVRTLHEWFRRPAGFFADHLIRYTKSRRQAPIYWPLSTTSGRYTLWLYYHRLTPDTLYKCLQQFVVPKLADAEKELGRLRTVLAASEGGVKERNRLRELEDLRRELIELRVELELWAPKWRPNLNDGVLITAAPLWKLFRLPKWQKDLKACWKRLEKGDYDWSHLAYSLWPDRVREKCKADRSLAIAHGLEDICEVKAPVKKVKKTKKKATKDDLQEYFEG